MKSGAFQLWVQLDLACTQPRQERRGVRVAGLAEALALVRAAEEQPALGARQADVEQAHLLLLGLPRAVAAQVDPFEKQILKPGNHLIGSMVETRRFQAMGQTGWGRVKQLYSPTVCQRVVGRRAGTPQPHQRAVVGARSGDLLVVQAQVDVLGARHADPRLPPAVGMVRDTSKP